jgi:hypothetical protein
MNLNEEIIKVCLKIAKRGEGALIIIGDVEYTPLVKQEVKEFNVIENPKLLESLALMDGAVVVTRNGMMKAYGVKLKSKLVWNNFGTRHSAGYSASMNDGTTAYIVSEEDSKVRIFKEGKLILEVDGKQKDIEKRIPEISKIMESVGWGTLGTIGAGLLAPFIGITIVSGITVFVVTTGLTYTIKKLQDWKWIK